DKIIKDTLPELYIKYLKIAGQGTVGLQFHAKEKFRIVQNSDKKQSCGEKDRTEKQKALLDDKKVQQEEPPKSFKKESQEIEETDDYKWIEKLKHIATLPPFIIKHEDATLEELEMVKVTVIDNLPEKCQELYWNVVDVSLITPDFPDFADAIDYSIKTSGLICNKKLKEILMSWKSGREDTILLFTVTLTPSPSSRNMCATIRCYQYGNGDNDHYEDFDYVGKDGIKKFKPISDRDLSVR
ncbi:10990_t:CDS:2, partial [Gigaspora margarita]